MSLSALLLAILSTLAAQPDRFGLPACSAPNQELAVRSVFVVCHSSTRHVPIWTAYELTPEHLNGSSPRPRHFRHDGALTGAGAYDVDYRNSGYSRGHLVPAADAAWSEEAIRATFLLSNAAPQQQAMNAGKWRQLEDAVRKLAAHSDTVIVFTGVLFESDRIETIGSGQVAVPTHMYKAVLVIRGESKVMYAAILPNASIVHQPLNSYAVSVAEVQRRTGLDFFAELEAVEQRRLEADHQGFPGN